MLTKKGGPEVLQVVELPIQAPGRRQLRVRVRATGVGASDLLMLEGQDDQVLDPKSSRKFLAHARCENKNLIIIPNCGHVLVSTHFLKPLVVSTIDDWLDLHTPGQFATNAIVAGTK